MTKIKIIGDPGKHNVAAIEKWIKKYLDRFNLSFEEIYVAFIKNARHLLTVYRKFQQGFWGIDSEKALLVAKIHFTQLKETAYIYEKHRKANIPPIILVKRTGVAEENGILDEVTHIKEEKEGWCQIKEEALVLLLEDSERLLMFQGKEAIAFPLELRNMINDFFADEMMCRYDLNHMVLKESQKELKKWIEIYSSIKGKSTTSRIYKFFLITAAIFQIILPPSYPQKDDEKMLEETIINYIREMSMEKEYRQIKSAISRLENQPRVANIYKCGMEIIQLAQDFLAK